MSAETSSQGPFRFHHAEDVTPFSAGQRVFSVGDPGDVMYAVRDGEVEVIVQDKVVEVVGPGGVFGEMALIDKQPRSATAVCRTDCQLIPINETRFKFLVQQTPFFAVEVMRLLVRRLRQMDVRK